MRTWKLQMFNCNLTDIKIVKPLDLKKLGKDFKDCQEGKSQKLVYGIGIIILIVIFILILIYCKHKKDKKESDEESVEIPKFSRRTKLRHSSPAKIPARGRTGV